MEKDKLVKRIEEIQEAPLESISISELKIILDRFLDEGNEQGTVRKEMRRVRLRKILEEYRRDSEEDTSREIANILEEFQRNEKREGWVK